MGGEGEGDCKYLSQPPNWNSKACVGWIMALSVAQELLARHAKLTLSNANEAETRIKLIDRVIFDILGWTPDDVSVEERVSEDGKVEFTDYTIRTGFSSLIIEAKRLGSSELLVPNIRKELLSRKLVSGYTGDAIKQARDYGRKLSVPFAVVTNGDQWIIFPASRTDQIEFEKSSAIIFSSLKSALEDDFADFHGLLSRKAVISGSLDNELLGRREDQINGRRLNLFFTRGFSNISRNSLFPLIESEIVTAFSEDIVSSDHELFAKSYVDTPERLKYDKRIGMHLLKRENPTNMQPMKAMTHQGLNRLSDSIERAVQNMRPLALLVLGTVGSGKTTFINHIREVRERERFTPTQNAPYPHWIYVDCRKLSPSETAMDFFIDEIFEYIKTDDFLSNYERCGKYAYKRDIEGLEKGPLSLLSSDDQERRRRIADFLQNDYLSKKPYAEKILAYASSKSAVFLVVDNVDQFEELAVQSRIFSDAIALAQRLKLSLVLAMRDSTFVENKNRPILDAFDFDPIQVEPPEVKAVLSRRFAVAKELLTGKRSEFVAENGAKVILEDSAIIIDLLVESILNTEVGNAISVLATGDIRLCLKMTREFLRNGYSATGKAIEIFQRTGRYRLPEHEAIRAIMLGSQLVYSEEFSPVANPFDAKLSINKAQLLRVFILNGVVARQSTRKTEGVTGETIRSVLLELGFGPEITLSVLKDMCDARYLFTVSHGVASFESTFVPSRLGGHVLRNMLPSFVFLENTMMDTFVDDDTVWESLKQMTSEVYAERMITQKIDKRVERVRLFWNYLTASYKSLQDEASRRAVSAEWQGNPFIDCRSALDMNLERVLSGARRNYGSK